jgi:hypothetical protein
MGIFCYNAEFFSLVDMDIITSRLIEAIFLD